jgi:MoaA/NifB/PqqE/SkfB family radical SAM enzyme
MNKIKYPVSLNIETTSICNLKCVMCTHSSTDFGRPKIHLNEKYFDELAPFIKNCEAIQLHGIGEPTLSPMFWKCLNILSKHTHSVTNTNLINISDDNMIKLVNSNLKQVSISMDSPVNETYYKIRGSDLQQLIDNVKKLLNFKRLYNSDLIVSFNMTLMKENFLEITQMIDLCHELNISILDTWPLNNWEGEQYDRKIRNWNFNYEDQVPWKFKELYNSEIDDVVEYSKVKNITFTFYKI